MNIDVKVNRQLYLLFACIAANCFANIPMWLLPEILSDSMEYLTLTAVQSSWVISAETFALAFSSIFFASRNFRFSYRRLGVVGSVIGLAGNFASSQCVDFSGLFAARAVAGFGEGALLMIANTLVADFNKPDRAYAHINVANIIYGSFAFFSLPFVFPHRDGLMVFNIAAIAMLAMAPFFYWLSTRQVQRTSHLMESDTLKEAPQIFSVSAITLYMAMMFIGTGCGASWGFLVEFGKAISLPQEQIDFSIGFGTIAAIAGSGLVAIIGTRYGRLYPVLLAIALAGISNYSLSHTEDIFVYRLGILGLLFSMYFILPFFLGYGADLDRSGRVSAIVCAIFMLTAGSIGPLAGGAIADNFDISYIGTAILFMCVISAVFTVIFARLDKSITPGIGAIHT